ncbi:hypothetical protein K402DRAFT_307960, partial [Aulographum hederae CBS 113979]
HIMKLDSVLADIERAGMTVSGGKLKLCVTGVEVVGFVCDSDGRHPTQSKIDKIMAWTHCENQKHVRAFLGIVGYY